MRWFQGVQFSSLKHQTVKVNGAYVSTKCDAKSSGNKKRIKDNGIQDSFPAAGFFCFVAAAPIFLISRVIFGKLEQLGRRAIKKSRRLKILFRRLNPAYNNANTIRSPSYFFAYKPGIIIWLLSHHAFLQIMFSQPLTLQGQKPAKKRGHHFHYSEVNAILLLLLRNEKCLTL